MTKSARLSNGYILLHLPDHPKSIKKGKNWNGYVYEHVVVAERFLKRPIRDNEVVHHLDGDRANNRIENLLVIERGQHAKLHEWMSKGANGIERFIEKGFNCRKPKETPKSLAKKCICGASIQRKNKRFCSEQCSSIANRRVIRPSQEELVALIKTMPMTQVGKKFGVTDNAVRKWLKRYGVSKAICSQSSGTPDAGSETTGAVQTA